MIVSPKWHSRCSVHCKPTTNINGAHYDEPAKTFNEMTRYIRVRSEPGDKFVEFDFAIGYPELFVELVLPREAFEIFCKHNNVVHMDSDMIREIDEDMIKWRFGERGQRY